MSILIDRERLKEGYVIAKCCSPKPPKDSITGFSSYNKVIVVHKTTCEKIKKIEPKRLLSLSWDEILEKRKKEFDKDYYHLDELDFRILKHHRVMGVDYSLMVSKILKIKPEQAFEHHKKLRYLKLLERVAKVMIQYRKNIVDNKWVKHRNHTYYRITPKGERYLDFHLNQLEEDSS